jgi:transposase
LHKVWVQQFYGPDAHVRWRATEDLPPGALLINSPYDPEARFSIKRELCGPVHEDTSWQASMQEGFDAARFRFDWEVQTVSCPQGKLSKGWKATHDRHGNPVVYITFGRDECLACPVRNACTRSKTSGRSLTVRPQAEHEAIQAARAHQKTPEFKQAYAIRAGVEGTLSQGIALSGLRRSRYIGVARTHLQHVITAAALNLVRVMDWMAEVPRATTRTSRFAALAAGSS